MQHALIQHALNFGIDFLRLCAWLLILAVIFVPLERLFALRPQRVFRRAVAADLGYYFLSSLLPALLLSVPLALVGRATEAIVPGSVHGAIAAWPLWLRAIAALLVGETGFYWGHRWTHEIPFLWRFHAIHHSAGEMDFLVNTRAHPVDLVFTRLCGLVPLYALGLAGPMGAAGSVIPLVIVLVGTVWGFFIHANVRWRFGILEHLFATPAFHHWHHTLSGPIDRNYAALLPGLDRLFGTLHLPRRDWPGDYGTQHAVPASFGGQLLRPLLGEAPRTGSTSEVTQYIVPELRDAACGDRAFK